MQLHPEGDQILKGLLHHQKKKKKNDGFGCGSNFFFLKIMNVMYQLSNSPPSEGHSELSEGWGSAF